MGPSAEVGTQIFDGKGGVSFAFNSSTNGNVGPGKATGTYKVNDDCTGTFTEVLPMTETTPTFTAHYSFVIDKNGVIAWSHLSPVLVNPGADGILQALEAL